MEEDQDASHTAHLIFPSSVPFYKTLSDISKASHSITNRLQSIARDADFVRYIAEISALPVVANERCGSWYVAPDLKASSAYFKSTDGHNGEWKFSLRRLNLQVLNVAGIKNGCIIVDSTKRGKHMPDAFSKTVPIWCAVMNGLLFPEMPQFHQVERLTNIISDSEYSQIEDRIPAFVENAKMLDLDIESLGAKIRKPLKPIWVARGLGYDLETADLSKDHDFLPLYLCMASEHHEKVDDGDRSYVQGAGDDVEHWAQGLTPQLYWEHQDELLLATESELPDLITTIVKCNKHGANARDCTTIIEQAQWLSIGTLNVQIADLPSQLLLILCTSCSSFELPKVSQANMLRLCCGEGKLGSRDLRKELPKVQTFLQSRMKPGSEVRVCCSSGTNLSVGVALVILCLYADNATNLLSSSSMVRAVDKLQIKRKLSWIVASMPAANPSRATLNAVNAYLMARDTLELRK